MSDLSKIINLIKTAQESNLHLVLQLIISQSKNEVEGKELFGEIVLDFFNSSGYTLSLVNSTVYNNLHKLGVFEFDYFTIQQKIMIIGKFLNNEVDYSKNIINGKNNNT